MNSRVTRHLAFVGLLALLALPLMSATGWAGGLDTLSPDLPPEGEYVSPAQYHEYAAMGIILDDPIHKPIVDRDTERYPSGPDGKDEREFFNSTFDATVVGYAPIHLTGPVIVETKLKTGNTTGTFATEIVSMNLSGNTPMGFVMVRQDQQRASTGQTAITDLGGMYHIDSFFDVFTELSMDGGATWVGSDYGTRMTLIPEPGTLVLLGMGALGFLAFLWRRKRAA